MPITIIISRSLWKSKKKKEMFNLIVHQEKKGKEKRIKFKCQGQLSKIAAVAKTLKINFILLDLTLVRDANWKCHCCFCDMKQNEWEQIISDRAALKKKKKLIKWNKSRLIW
jgi:hypothetical protein